MSNEPTRPDTVPPEAIWNEAENEWEIGEHRDGVPVGEWKWWLAPTGHLCCHTFYDDNGNIKSFTRYHPDGTMSRKGTYKDGVEHGITTYQRSHNPTLEGFPPDFDEQIWRIEAEYVDGEAVAIKCFTEDGTELVPRGCNDSEGDEDERAVEQVNFGSVEEASKRWIEEGLAFKNGLNAWLDQIYRDEEGPEDPEPQETRQDMAEYVLSRIVEFNGKGEHKKLREMFPPSYEPFADYYENIGRSISQLHLLNDGRIAVKVGEYYQDENVYLIDGDSIEEQKDIYAIGASYDKKYIAKAYFDKIDVCEGWDGTVICSLPYPKDLGDDFAEKYPDVEVADMINGEESSIISIDVFPDGKSIVLASRVGIFVITEDGFQRIHPNLKMMDNEIENFKEDEDAEFFWPDLDYPHAALSPNGQYIAVGSQDSAHIVLHKTGDSWEETAWIQPRSSYPHWAKFHDELAHVALSSCHFSGSATTGLKMELLPNFTASAWDADERLQYIDERFWVFSIAPMPEGYLLGDNNGYIWYMAFDGPQLIGYVHLGSTIMSMDITEDKKTLVVGTYAGYVVKLSLGEIKDPNLITNIDIKEEERWIFWNGQKPMIW